MRSNRFWIAILGCVLAMSASAAVFMTHFQTQSSHAHIYQNGVLIDVLDLSQAREPFFLTAQGSGPGGNTIEVEQGRIRISQAHCPDELCVRQGWVSGGPMPIVCLPHRLVIRMVGGDDFGVDAVVG